MTQKGRAFLSGLTHGGGIVFKLTSDGPRYLLVEASGTRDRWVFPKGHIEEGESGALAAMREVAEEAGVRARLVRRLKPVEQKKAGERIAIVYFLMAYAGRKTPLDKRRVRWLSFDEAIDALDLGKSRRVLRAADRLISAATGAEPARYRIRRAVAHFAEWLALGALALLFVAPIPPLAALLALPAGMLMSLAMRVLLRLRLLVGGAQWVRRTDYLGGPVRICAALAVLLPWLPASGAGWLAPLIAIAGSVFAFVAAFALAAACAIAWWRLERRRASVLAAVM